MLVHVKRDELLAIAAQTAKAAPKTATSEAVLGIHVEADSRRSMLTLTATNYEIVIRASMGASVEQSGSVVISAALFPAAIASLPEQDVDLETEHPGQLTIRSGHARFRLSALSGDKVPMPELPFRTTPCLSAASFAGAQYTVRRCGRWGALAAHEMRPAPCRTGRTESVRLKWLLHHGGRWR